MAAADSLLNRFRQPEYTGENRCIPCTVVNTIIAIGLGAFVALIGLRTIGRPFAGFGIGLTVVALSLVVIYLRGYLIPGTPELTKQYFPPWVLALFGKEPEPDVPAGLGGDIGDEIADVDLETVAGIDAETAKEVDPETALVRMGALEECEDGQDLCLTDAFRDAWQAELEALDSDVSRANLLDLLGMDAEDVTFEEHGRAFRARSGGRAIGTWESEAAFLADIAAARVFASEYPGWDELPNTTLGTLLNGLRLFIDTCPSCGGTPSFGADSVESCCSTYEVAAVTCDECDVRLFEAPLDPQEMTEA